MRASFGPVPAPDVSTTLLFVAANVRRRRLELGLTQEQFAERARLDLRFFRFVEQGVKDISISSLVRLAAGLGCRPHELLLAAEPLERKPGRPRRSPRATPPRRVSRPLRTQR
jgi:transcriptional regulator with XRE-family HTH domain